MRAVLIDSDFKVDMVLELSEDQAHHFNVARLKLGDSVLVLNGKGEVAHSEILFLTKKSGQVKVLSFNKENRKHNISLAIGVPKKDAFEDIVKISVELGIHSIFPLSTQFSQFEVENSDRLNRLIESAIVQSNNLFWPNIYQQKTLEKFLENYNGILIYFSSRPSQSKFDLKFDIKDEVVILIGPEGGFSEAEEAKIMAYKNVKMIHLPTPIMRAPTAVGTSVGYLLSSFEK